MNEPIFKIANDLRLGMPSSLPSKAIRDNYFDEKTDRKIVEKIDRLLESKGIDLKDEKGVVVGTIFEGNFTRKELTGKDRDKSENKDNSSYRVIVEKYNEPKKISEIGDPVSYKITIYKPLEDGSKPDIKDCTTIELSPKGSQVNYYSGSDINLVTVDRITDAFKKRE